MKQLSLAAVALLLFYSQALAVDARDSKTIKITFVSGKSSDYELNPFAASIVENPEQKNKFLLKIDTRKSEAQWNACFNSAQGILKPNTDYTVNAQCKILESNDDSYIFSLIRPLGVHNDYSDMAHSVNAKVGVWEKIQMRFHVPSDVSNYAFQIHTSRKVLALIKDVEIRESSPSKQESVSSNISPRKLPESLPKGADEFTIDLPHPKNVAVESVSKYGADVSNPDNTKAFNDAIAHCAAMGISKLVVPKGIYRFTSDAPVHFEKLKDFEFDGQGSVFVFLKKRDSLIKISKNERTFFKNFSVDWDWDQDPLACVIKVESIEPSGEYADFRLVDYKNFPKKNIRVATIDLLNPKTLTTVYEKKLRLSFQWLPGISPAKVEWKESNLLRIYAEDRNAAFKANLSPGMFFRLKQYYYDMPGIFMEDNSHLTLLDVNIYSTPGMGFVSFGTQHHSQFINVKVAPPLGSKRPISSTADQFNVAQTCGFIKLEGCEFTLAGDDAVNIHDCSGFGYKTGDFTLRTMNDLHGAHSYHIGDAIEFRNDDYSPTGFTSKIKSKIPVDEKKKSFEFTFEDRLPEEKTSGFVLFNRRYGANQIIIRNCHFHDCGRVLLLGKNMTVENNRFMNCASTPLKIETGYTLNAWSEGYGASNIVIRNNTFDRVNVGNSYPNEKSPVIYMSVYLKSDPSSERTLYPILHDILIEGNSFKNFPEAILYVCSAQNVFIRNNTIDTGTHRAGSFLHRGSIAIAYTSNFFVTQNSWTYSKDTGTPFIIFDPETTENIHSWGNTVISK